MPIQQMMLGLGETASIITQNLLFHYDIGNSSSYSGSGTTVNDLSGNGNDATLENQSYSSNDGGYLIFNNEGESNSNRSTIEIDGSNNNSDFAIGTGQFSFEVWLYVDDTPANAQSDELYIGGQDRFGNNDNKGVVFKYIHYSSTNSLSVTFGDGVIGEPSGFSVAHTIPTTTWTYVAIGRRSGNEVFINVDGDDKYTATFARDLLTPHEKFEIGNGLYSSREWDGRIAIARYSIGGSLSESDLLHNYNTQKSRFGL
jgi:hypothetical protein